MGQVNILKIDKGIVRLIQIVEGTVSSILLSDCYITFNPEVKRFGKWEDFTLRGKMTITDDYTRSVHTHGYIDSLTMNQYICIGSKRYHVDQTVFEYGDAGDTIRLRVEGCFLEVGTYVRIG